MVADLGENRLCTSYYYEDGSWIYKSTLWDLSTSKQVEQIKHSSYLEAIEYHVSFLKVI